MALLVCIGVVVVVAVPLAVWNLRRARRWRRAHPDAPMQSYVPWGWPSQQDLEKDPGFVPGWPDVPPPSDDERPRT